MKDTVTNNMIIEGQSCLHQAILSNDIETVQLLLQCGVDVESRALGPFFKPTPYGNKAHNASYDGWLETCKQ